MATGKKAGSPAAGKAQAAESDYDKIKKERALADKKSRSKRALIETVRKGGIGSSRVTEKYKSPERAFQWLKDPEQGEKTWKESGRLYHNKGGRATHGYGKAYLKGGKVK